MQSGIPEFKTVAKTFRGHREGILNGYRYGKTNALAEGLNNTIKLIKKTSYGLPTFARMRRRRLFTLVCYKLTRDYVHLPQVDAKRK
jgi:transposase